MDEEKRGKTKPALFCLLLFLLFAAFCGTWGMTAEQYAGQNAPAISVLGTGETQAKTVIPLGRAVGIKLFSSGVVVVGLADIPTQSGSISPARDCGLQTGDLITHIDGQEVNSIETVQALLQQQDGGKLSINAQRGDEQLQFTATAAMCTDGTYKLGAWIRDSLAGIGTMTYYDPDTGSFAALGHGINDVDTMLLMPLQSGSIMPARVACVQKGAAGAPGQLLGQFAVEHDLGTLTGNTDNGIFGTLEDTSMTEGLTPVEVASASQVHTGEVEILSNISEDTVESFTAKIIHIYPTDSGENRNFMLEITDRRLLDATGGIVQGMSGSPILQDGKLIGAVTHVLLNDSTRGYGIFAENMLKAASNNVS